MALTRIPLPSFTLVLTSGPRSLREYPTAIKFDSSFPAMRPSARDHLMQTIDLRGEPDDDIQDPLNTSAMRVDHGRIHLETIFEEEVPATSLAVDKKQATRTTKQYVSIKFQSLLRKLLSVKGTAPN